MRWGIVRQHRKRSRRVVRDSHAHWYNYRGQVNGISCLAETDVVQGIATAIREQPDLILFDIDLPGGGGLLFLDRLRATLPISNIPVIVVTAQTDPGIQATARAQSAVAVLDKPIKKEELIDVVRQVLGTPPPNRC